MKSNSMKLSIYSLEKTLYQGEAKKIIAQTTTGEITVLDTHIPLITVLRGPVVTIIDKNNKQSIIEIVSGFLEVRPESKIVVLTS